ncbi:MAG: DsbA family protein [Alphaproteobacteria bacterium]|nr:DsbA family protein [Alphaproteobacteria bacterium]
MKDRVLGDPNAPVTIIEYASLTCPHCAHFDTEILPQVKKQLLDTGKAKLIYRDFPLDNFALKAAMMARCVSPLKYFDMIDVLFTNQERWIKAKDPMAALAQLGSLAGMDASQFKACTENADLQTDIVTNMKQAERVYKVNSTPTFVFNDGAAQFAGAYPVTKFEEVVASLTKAGQQGAAKQGGK